MISKTVICSNQNILLDINMLLKAVICSLLTLKYKHHCVLIVIYRDLQKNLNEPPNLWLGFGISNQGLHLSNPYFSINSNQTSSTSHSNLSQRKSKELQCCYLRNNSAVDQDDLGLPLSGRSWAAHKFLHLLLFD